VKERTNVCKRLVNDLNYICTVQNRTKASILRGNLSERLLFRPPELGGATQNKGQTLRTSAIFDQGSKKVIKLFRMLSKEGPVRTLDEFRCYWLARETRRIERDHGLELAKFTELRDLTVEGDNEKFGNPYGPTPPRSLPVLLENFGPDFSRTTFVDLGSGKALAMLLASHFNFKKIIGVEFAIELHEAALRNVAKYSSPGQKCKDLELNHGDALEYDFPEDDLLVYLCNPFTDNLLREIINKLIRLREKTGRKISIVYLQMRREDGEYRTADLVKQALEESGKLVRREIKIRRIWDRITLSHLTFMAYDLR
jgi:hypothetical protein